MNTSTDREISCRVTRTLLLYVREQNNGSLGTLLDGLDLDEEHLLDPNNWVSHSFLHVLYHRMIAILGDDQAVYKMAFASGRFQSLGLLDDLARLLGNPKLIYAQAPKYNRLLKLNGDVHIHEMGDSWVVLEDRYHNSAQKTRYDCDYTRGVLVAIPTIFDMPPAYVEEIECQVAPDTYGKRIWPDTPTQGGRGCLYRVRWEKARRIPLRKRLFGRWAVYRKAIDDLQEANRRIQEKYDEARKLASDLETANKQLLESKRQLESKAANLLASEKQYRFLAENVSDIIWTLSLKSMRFDYCTPSVERIRGFTAEEAMQLSLEQTLPPQSLEIVTKILAEELAKEGEAGVNPDRHRTIEIQQLCKDGSYAWAEAQMSFIRNEEGRPVGVLGVTRDISERKRAEKALADRTSQLERTNRKLAIINADIQEFTNLATHDLQEPLRTLIAFSDLLPKDLGDSLPEPAVKDLNFITDAAKRMQKLAQDLLAFSRAGRVVKKRKKISLDECADRALEALAMRVKERGAQITREKLPEVWGDLTLLTELYQNLISNALKFSGDQPPIIQLTFEEKDGDQIFGVKDNGIGIDPKYSQQIFQPFRRLHGNAEYEGSGIGLAICRRIVERHGGKIWVDSRPGKGAHFRFTISRRMRER